MADAVNERFRVGPDEWVAWTFAVPERRELHLKLAADDDVRVLLLDEDQFDRYRGGRPFRAAYEDQVYRLNDYVLPPYPADWSLVVENAVRRPVRGTIIARLVRA